MCIRDSAVRKYQWLFQEWDVDEYLILSGDQLYRMDYSLFVEHHRKTGADLTVAALPVDAAQAEGFGLMRTDNEGNIKQFSEKPKGDALNAMAVDTETGELFDPYEGVKDLEEMTLRTPMDPEESFTDDPLRILRAARFIAAYGFSPTGDLLHAAQKISERLNIVSIERIRDEISSRADSHETLSHFPSPRFPTLFWG